MFHNIQSLLNMSQHSHNSHILILSFKIFDKEIYGHLGSVPLFKQFTYTNKIQFSMSR